jgi:hypothetical protein
VVPSFAPCTDPNQFKYSYVSNEINLIYISKINAWVDEWIYGSINGTMDGWIDGFKDGFVDGWNYVWMDG